MFGGGPLGKQVGDVLVSANVTLFNLYGRCVALFPLKHISVTVIFSARKLGS